MKRILFLIIFSAVVQPLAAQRSVIDTFIAPYAKANNFSGTVLLAKNNKNIYEKVLGMPIVLFQVSNSIDTKYKIASITKLFTAVLIMQLQEQGVINLTRTIKAYLPDYQGEAGEKVTIHQLLNHTSGMVSLDTITSVESALKNGIVYQHYLSSDEMLLRYCSDTLVTEPGKVFNYNNADYIVLGKILERMHGKSFDQILKENILAPLGMNNTGMLYQHSIIKALADTYFFRDDLNRLVNDLPVFIEDYFASGAMYSTVGDLLKFANALYNNRLIIRERVKQIATPGLGDYGYGVWVYDTPVAGKNYITIKRPGRIMGAQGQFVHFPSEALTIIILSNTGTDLDQFVYEISTRLLGR